MGVTVWTAGGLATNLQKLKPTRRHPEIGDVFAANVLGESWVLGRVIDNRACHFGKDNLLLYFYKMRVESPEAAKTPILPTLLVPPIITSAAVWRMGAFKVIRNAPLQDGEVLRQHFFMANAPFVEPASLEAIFWDQYRHEIKDRPREGDYWSGAGVSNLKSIDDKLSGALGIPGVLEVDRKAVAAAKLDLKRHGNSEEAQLVLRLPLKPSVDSIDIGDLEDDLVQAIERTDVGRWEGHEVDLEARVFDIRFFGQEIDAMVEAMRPVLRVASASLPRGWKLISRSSDGLEKQIRV